MIEASAPVRICDVGGWTDTWFGGPGRVRQHGGDPGVEVVIRPTRGSGSGGPRRQDVRAPVRRRPGRSRAPRHPLLESAIDAYPPPGDRPVEISVRSAVPAGCGTGTSAAVSIALLAALAEARSERLFAPRPRLRRPPPRGRHPGHPERDPGPAVRGVRRDQRHRGRSLSRRRGPDPPGLGRARLPADPRLPGTGPQLVRPAPPGHRRPGRRGVGGLRPTPDAAASARDAVLAQDLDAFGRRHDRQHRGAAFPAPGAGRAWTPTG